MGGEVADEYGDNLYDPVGAAMADASKVGLTAFQGTPRLLLLDFDTWGAWNNFNVNSRGIFQHYEINPDEVKVFQTYSKSRRWHVYCLLPKPKDVLDLIGMEFTMGGDAVKVKLDKKRLEAHPEEDPRLLFEVPEEAAKVSEWLREVGA